jgi:hypothetical protein
MEHGSNREPRSSRYVILEHTYQGVHFDLMLEAQGKLRTWRLPVPPQPGSCIVAEASFDHRLHYLDYEGPISGDRGHVRRWDHGTFTGDPSDTDAVHVELQGEHLRGSLQLQRRDDTHWEVRILGSVVSDTAGRQTQEG